MNATATGTRVRVTDPLVSGPTTGTVAGPGHSGMVRVALDGSAGWVVHVPASSVEVVR